MNPDALIYLSNNLKSNHNQWSSKVYMQPRIEKSIARLLTVKFAPECGEVLALYRAKRDGWIKMPEEIEQIRKNSGLGGAYVLAYEEESRILSCFMRSICPEDTVKIKLMPEYNACIVRY